jgi:hypothetical protein
MTEDGARIVHLLTDRTPRPIRVSVTQLLGEPASAAKPGTSRAAGSSPLPTLGRLDRGGDRVLKRDAIHTIVSRH